MLPADDDAGFLDAASRVKVFSDFEGGNMNEAFKNLTEEGASLGQKATWYDDMRSAIARNLRLASGALLCSYVLILAIYNGLVLLLSEKGGKTSAFSWVLSVGSVDFVRREV